MSDAKRVQSYLMFCYTITRSESKNNKEKPIKNLQTPDKFQQKKKKNSEKK